MLTKVVEHKKRQVEVTRGESKHQTNMEYQRGRTDELTDGGQRKKERMKDGTEGEMR